jgi:hypothetical protein
MNIKTITYGLIMFLLMVSIFTSGCINNVNGNDLSSKKYVAIEADLRADGNIISGYLPPTASGDAMPPIPFYYNKDLVHMYYYNNSVDYPLEYPIKNESMKILLGEYHIQNRPWTETRTLSVIGIYGYPYTFDNGPTILNVDKNGTVQMAYHNQSFNVTVGEEWTSPIISTNVETYNGTTIVEGAYSYTVKFNTTWIISNLGLYEK